MNITDLWSGDDYVWYHERGRGENYRWNGRRVKVIRTYKKRANYENERLSGYAEVMMLEDDGTPKTDSVGDHISREIRARDVAMRWDEYEQERAYRQEKRDKEEREYQERMARMRQEREIIEERERKEREAREAIETAKRLALTDKLVERLGIEADAIYINSSGYVQISRLILEREFGLVSE